MNRSYTVDPDVMSQQLGDTLVLLHLRTDKFYELNSTAALAWELISSGLDSDSIARSVTSEFDVSTADFRREFQRVTAELERAGLIH